MFAAQLTTDSLQTNVLAQNGAITVAPLHGYAYYLSTASHFSLLPTPKTKIAVDDDLGSMATRFSSSPFSTWSDYPGDSCDSLPKRCRQLCQAAWRAAQIQASSLFEDRIAAQLQTSLI